MFNIGNLGNNIINKNKEEISYDLDMKGVNNLRSLAIDMIDKAGSGHPGICLGAASIIYTLFKRHLNINLDDLDFVNRDRFILSAGHGAPLLYSICYMLDLLTLDDIKSLRRINSKTPGHPEYLKTPLVEVTTGPLGQGIAASVGMAIASKHLNQKTDGLIDYYTYVLCGDGELEEGITYEALTLAGTLKLNNLIVLYDSNGVTLDSNLKTSSQEDIKMRFESINFKVIEAENTPKSIDEAISLAKNSEVPSIIIVKTIIGEFSKYAGTNLAHGKVLEKDDLLNVKEKMGLYQTPFTLSSEVKEDFKNTIIERGKLYYKNFEKKYEKSKNKILVDKLIKHEITYNLTDIDISYDNKSLRDLSGDILNHIANNFELLIGGSADVSSSCRTNLVSKKIFQSDSYDGRNLYFGIREHAMAGILNGLALSGLRPFGSTFLTFSDYMRGSIRLSCLMNLGVIYILTHDSFTVGEDGPTHEPVEQLISLEAIPNLKVYRPFDLNELIGSYVAIMEETNPAALILPRESKDISEYTKTSGVKEGMYVVIPNETDDYINLIANGEELGLVLKVSENLKEIGVDNRVLSVPCMKNLTEKTKEKLLEKRSISITFGSPLYYYSLTKDVIGVSTFGQSGTKEELLEYFEFTPKKLESKILELLNK